MKAFRFICSLSKRYPLLLTACTALWVLVGLFEAAAIVTIAPVVDILVSPGLETSSSITRHVTEWMGRAGLPVTLGGVLCVFFAFNLIKSVFQIAARYMILKMKYAVERDLYLGTFTDFFRARWYFFTSGKEGTLLNTFMRESVVVGNAFGAMALLFAAALQLIFYLGVPLYISWQVTALSVVAGLVFGGPFLLFGRYSYGLGRLNTSTSNELTGVVQESLSGAKLILGYGNQDKNAARLRRIFEVHVRAAVRSQTLSAGIPIAYLPLGLVVMGIALVAGGRMGVPLAESAALLYSLMRTVPIIGQILSQKVSIENFFPSYEQIQALRARAKELQQRPGGKPYDGMQEGVELKGLSFSYPGGAKVLEGIDLRIPKGKMVGFVGESGGGKSTLLDMILGLHEPTSGTLSIDGTELRDLDLASYRRRLGYVPQDGILFNMSIRDNLCWAVEDATGEEIERACVLANADDFIREMPEGYDTVVGDRGVRLSGGQAQRIALARAILRKPDLLLLDEATSALDTKSERLIQKSVEKIAKEATVVVVAHRLSTIKNADRIYVIEKGRLVEQGGYSELVGRNGRFARMVDLQELEAAK